MMSFTCPIIPTSKYLGRYVSELTLCTKHCCNYVTASLPSAAHPPSCLVPPSPVRNIFMVAHLICLTSQKYLHINIRVLEIHHSTVAATL